MDYFKIETIIDYTCFDLNCQRIVPHTKEANKMEKKVKRKARRKLKQNLKKDLTTTVDDDTIKT